MHSNSRIYIELPETESPLPLVICRAKDGSEFLSMFDTGSEVTIFDSDLNKYLVVDNAESGDVTLHTLHGEVEVPSIPSCRGTFTVYTGKGKECDVTLKGIVSDLSSVSSFLKKSYGFERDLKMIIGSDTMRILGWTIDFNQGLVVL